MLITRSLLLRSSASAGRLWLRPARRTSAWPAPASGRAARAGPIAGPRASTPHWVACSQVRVQFARPSCGSIASAVLGITGAMSTAAMRSASPRRRRARGRGRPRHRPSPATTGPADPRSDWRRRGSTQMASERVAELERGQCLLPALDRRLARRRATPTRADTRDGRRPCDSARSWSTRGGAGCRGRCRGRRCSVAVAPRPEKSPS